MQYAPTDLIGFQSLRMPSVGFPILLISLNQLRVVKNQYILSILLLRGLREVERSRDHGFAVHDDYFIVGGLVISIEKDGNTRIEEGLALGKFFEKILTIEEYLDLHSPVLGRH